MPAFSLQEVQCFDSVVRLGSYQAASVELHRSHPAVFESIKKLERKLGVSLFDRSGNRVRPTKEGLELHGKAQQLLQQVRRFGDQARHLAAGAEPEVKVAIGDLCPVGPVLESLACFFRPTETRLHVTFESVTGPWERLLAGDVDLIFHRVPAGDLRFESIFLGVTTLVPVIRPGLLSALDVQEVSTAHLRDISQCFLRDSARQPPEVEYFSIPGAPRCTVPDLHMKKELIMKGLAWGYLPQHFMQEDLREGRLVSIAGSRVPVLREDIFASRLSGLSRGPVASRLWEHVKALELSLA